MKKTPPVLYDSAGAAFDEPLRVYRYRLWRMWGGTLTPRAVLWIMLNPSTADEHVLDPTLRRCQGFSRAWGYDGFEVVNLFALRSTNPEMLARHHDPIGAENNRTIQARAQQAELIVCGWGGHKFAGDRAEYVRTLLSGHELFCLGRSSKSDQPNHPLYLPASTVLEAFA